MLLLGLMVAACEAPLPPSQSRDEVSVPRAPMGLIVGVVVVAETPQSPPDLGPSAAGTFFRVGAADAYPREVVVTDFQTLDSVARVEDGVPVRLRPFALRLPAGEGGFRTLAIAKGELKVRQQTYMAGHWDLRERTSYDTSAVVSDVPLPTATFTVEAGKVTYVGRIGVLFHGVDYGRRLSTDGLPCERLQRDRSVAGHAICVAREPFVGSDPATDLPLIRQAYARLAAIDIDVQPVRVAPGSWPSLADAARLIRIKPAND